MSHSPSTEFGSNPKMDACTTAPQSVVASHFWSNGVCEIEVNATRIMRSGVICFGSAAAICDLYFSSSALTVVRTFGLLGTVTIATKAKAKNARTIVMLNIGHLLPAL